MKPFQAANCGFAQPNCRYFKVELSTEKGPSLYFKVGAESESDALAFAKTLTPEKIVSHRVREISQFSAVLSNASVAL